MTNTQINKHGIATIRRIAGRCDESHIAAAIACYDTGADYISITYDGDIHPAGGFGFKARGNEAPNIRKIFILEHFFGECGDWAVVVNPGMQSEYIAGTYHSWDSANAVCRVYRDKPGMMEENADGEYQRVDVAAMLPDGTYNLDY